jgi:hypothetical protein
MPGGPVANFTRKRTRLAIAFDGPADVTVRRAIAAKGGWVSAWVPSPGWDDYLDQGGLTAHERAFQQALYYHRRVYLWGGGYVINERTGVRERVRNPQRTHALHVEWTDQSGTLGRRVRVRARKPGEASLWAKRAGWTG